MINTTRRADAPRADPLDRLWVVLVASIGAIVALVSARPYAGGWHDGSRLAAVESLVDYHTLSVERSIFVDPRLVHPSAPPPYPLSTRLLIDHGTRDLLLIDGRYYSDKSPIPNVLMAGLYLTLQRATGLTARARADRFCYWMTVLSSGIAYVVAVSSIFALAYGVLASRVRALIVTCSFAFATVALTYARHVNNYILLLAVIVFMLMLLHRTIDQSGRLGDNTRLFWLGTLSGLGYTIDLGSGPVFLLCSFVLITYRRRTASNVVAFLAGAVPWVLFHHVLNYALGDTFRPVMTVPEYVLWPGSAQAAERLTGHWGHDGLLDFARYAVEILVGKRGFLFHNLPLLLMPLALWWPLAAPSKTGHRPEILYARTLVVATWLLYATLSSSLGESASIRWFVPLLAPAYYVLMIYLREWPQHWTTFLVLSSWGLVMGGLMWWKGPWMPRMVPLYWMWVVLALASWSALGMRGRGKPANHGCPVKL